MNKESFCKGKQLHVWQIVGHHPSGTLEQCLRCRKRMFWKEINGRIENYKYIQYHNRDLLPKIHPYYLKEYGQ